MKYAGLIAATAKFDDEVDELKEAGVQSVYNFYTEVGHGFAEHVCEILDVKTARE